MSIYTVTFRESFYETLSWFSQQGFLLTISMVVGTALAIGLMAMIVTPSLQNGLRRLLVVSVEAIFFLLCGAFVTFIVVYGYHLYIFIPNEISKRDAQITELTKPDVPVVVPKGLNDVRKTAILQALGKFSDIINNVERPAARRAFEISQSFIQGGAILLPDSVRELDNIRLQAKQVMESLFESAIPDPFVREMITTQAIQNKDREIIILFHLYCEQVYDGLTMLQVLQGIPAAAPIIPNFRELLSERVRRLRDYSAELQALVDKTNNRISDIEQRL